MIRAPVDIDEIDYGTGEDAVDQVAGGAPDDEGQPEAGEQLVVRQAGGVRPDADERGYVAYPNINPVAEMVDLMGAVRSYQLNASAVNASKQMIQQSIDLLRS